MVNLPGADEESDLEPRFTRAPGARADHSADRGRDPVGETTVDRQNAHQFPKEVLVVELESQRHLPSIVDDRRRFLPTKTSHLYPDYGLIRLFTWLSSCLPEQHAGQVLAVTLQAGLLEHADRRRV